MNLNPKPLPPHSPRLRNYRYEAWVGGEKKPNGGRPMIAEGRFVCAADAQLWADQNYPDAPVVKVTAYAARNGWQSRYLFGRKNGRWQDLDGNPV